MFRNLCKSIGYVRIQRTIMQRAVKQYHHIAIVGTGPSAFYTAKYCLDINPDIRVDMFERLPTPYGLVRYGVAPDHPEVKTVEETFTQVAESGRVRLFANIEISDNNESSLSNVLPMNELIKSYSGVVLAYGASSDIDLNIPGEHLSGVISSRKFVNWYNGHPDYANIEQQEFNLKNVEHVVIIGQGNVALDCARILSKSVNDLNSTDISINAINELKNSNIKTITIIGRRGYIQSAFTIKEIRELTRIKDVNVYISESDIECSRTTTSLKEVENNRPKKRLTELIENIAKASHNNTTNTTTATTTMNRQINIRYLTTPIEIIANEHNQVSGLKVIRNQLIGDINKQKAIPIVPTETTILPCDMVIKAVGYKCQPITKSIPFNTTTNTIPHKYSRVLQNSNSDNNTTTTTTSSTTDTNNSSSSSPLPGSNTTSTSSSPLPGVYVSGWLKRGATGIIASNIPDAKETAAAIAEDIQSDRLRSLDNALLTKVKL